MCRRTTFMENGPVIRYYGTTGLLWLNVEINQIIKYQQVEQGKRFKYFKAQ